MEICKTAEVARMMDVSYWRLYGLLRSGHIDPPAKDASGDFVWRVEDIERARDALRQREAVR